jgi:hypothetical protein
MLYRGLGVTNSWLCFIFVLGRYDLDFALPIPVFLSLWLDFWSSEIHVGMCHPVLPKPITLLLNSKKTEGGFQLHSCKICRVVGVECISVSQSSIIVLSASSCIVKYQGFAWLIKRGLDLTIEFIGPLYNLLQHFTNHCLLLDTLRLLTTLH